MLFSLAVMISVALVTLGIAYYCAQKYRVRGAKKPAASRARAAAQIRVQTPPHKAIEALEQIGIWLIPIAIVVILGPITWRAAHALDPYRPLAAEMTQKPLTVQVVALNWKWLFIYPEQNIAAVNILEIPAGVPVDFELTASNAPMNSFWIPALGGQIYAMPGMMTQLHLMADAPGVFAGKAAEINGPGYAGMTFITKAATQQEFDAWVTLVKKGSNPLSKDSFDMLKQPSQNIPPAYYSSVENGLFNEILMENMSGMGSSTDGGSSMDSMGSMNHSMSY